MGVYEEAQIRLVDIQKRINRVYEAGDALTKIPSDKTAKTKFRMMYTTVPKLLEEFEIQFTVIIKQRGKPDKDQKMEEEMLSTDVIREKFDEAYFSVLMVADEHLPTLQHTMASDDTFVSLGHARPNVNFIPVEKLAIPTFNGNIKEYFSFRNLFDELVNNNKTYQPIVKFSYLKSKLEGEPLKLVTNLMLSDSNYDLALKILDKRYSNKRVIAHSHFDQLWDMPKAVFGDSKSIRQVLNCITESVGGLENQRYAVDQWDPMLLYLFEKKLDAQLRAQWELLVDTNDDPTVEEFVTFLTKFCNAASASNQSGGGREKIISKYQNKTTTLFSAAQGGHRPSTSARYETSGSKNQFSCQVCKLTPGHLLIACTVFKDKSPKERHQIIKELRRCYLCFSEHTVTQCQKTKLCSHCGGRHHSMLHLGVTDATAETSVVNACFTSSTQQPLRTCVLLATVAVLVQDVNGVYQEARALLDSGSQSSFLTENCRKRLGIPRQKCDVTVQAVSGVPVSSIKARSTIVIRPIKCATPLFTINTFVLQKITGLTPTNRVWKAEWSHISGLDLADPRFNETLPVDILLGADVFPYITCGNCLKGKKNEPVALETKFGWALMGNTLTESTFSITTLHTSLEVVDETLRRFWEIEELPLVSKTSPDEQECENIYRNTTTRQPDGRYVVHLPFTCYPPPLGESQNNATKRLIQLESRLTKSAELRSDYNNAMKDYLDSGHMKQIETQNSETNPSYYIPHHAVVKANSSTTRVRIVYDASAVTSNGKSLNDYLYSGPKLQQDLSGIIIRFRLHSIVFTADVKQMFRQILVTPKHLSYQRLVYRFQHTNPIETFEMTTVTFGQRSSPYLAIRTLHQLATDEGLIYPDVKRVIFNDLYVDDVATGTDCEESALQLQKDIIKVFKSGCFDLRKWSSNSVKLLEAVPPEYRQTDPVTFQEPTTDYTKVLGLKWEPNSDRLAYNYQPNPVRYNKRAILSEIARIYDPIGLLTPVTTTLKRLMKYLWSTGVGWDNEIPKEAAEVWTRYHNELPFIGSIYVPRQITTKGAKYEVHGFCDSSEVAYAASVYLLARLTDATTSCKLIMAKSKVAPEKTLSIPRLELCGALLLARLINYLRPNLQHLNINNYTAWSDSTVTLAWIQSPTSRLKTFVANRVAQIQHMTPPEIWRHVPTAHNPADCASRGLTPKELVEHPLWWTGPTFLMQPSNKWPQKLILTDHGSEDFRQEEKPVVLLTVLSDDECKILYASSDLAKVLRLTAYLCRFGRWLAHKPTMYDETKPPGTKEKDEAMHALLRWVQRIHFSDDWNRLTLDKPCSSKLRMLGAYMDPNVHLIRVGGRLSQSDLPYTAKHPILLPKKSQMTVLLIDYVHRLHCHPGPQTTQSILHQEYWIMSARSAIRKRLHQCVSCFRAKPKALQPMMGNLPRFRLSAIKAFCHVGVDFAGPFWVKAALLRRIQATKGYLCIFVCMATRAVHLELVSDLTTSLFLAALTRFVSRRGRCTDLYSDCGTNFIGAKRYLEEVQALMASEELVNGIVQHEIKWHLNPPAAPHMGGLWEAAVKSAKTLLHRTIKEQILTYEELNTVFHHVEAVLNSRPLSALSSDPNDYQPLTAGHFLTTEPLVSLPSPFTSVQTPKFTLHQRWTYVQRLNQHFWERWHKDYLHTIQVKSKWNYLENNLVPGDLVIIKEPTPALAWKTARVVNVYPGEDGIVRVASVQTADGTVFKRPAVKLCRLPIIY